MGGAHKRPPLSFRPPECDRVWLERHAAETGQPVNRVLADALAAFREHVEQAQPQVLRVGGRDGLG